jgi:hypothetical protein
MLDEQNCQAVHGQELEAIGGTTGGDRHPGLTKHARTRRIMVCHACAIYYLCTLQVQHPRLE